MIVYDRFWETMKAKNLNQYKLIKNYGFSAGQISRLKKNMYVSTHTLDVLCRILDCKIEDLMEYRVDIGEDSLSESSKSDERNVSDQSGESDESDQISESDEFDEFNQSDEIDQSDEFDGSEKSNHPDSSKESCHSI